MASTRFDEIRDYGFADKALALRERAGLTQRALAALLGVSVRAIQAWEAGLSYPEATRLAQVIALYVVRGAFPTGREEDEAAALWEAVRVRAPRRVVPFDRDWFAALHGTAGAASLDRPHTPEPASGAPGLEDWGEAPDAGIFYGRIQELDTLSRWLLAERCRLVAVLGLGGIGKTLLAARLAREVAPRFAGVYWRSLRNVPPVEEWLAGAIATLSAQQILPPDGFAARLGLLLELLQTQRGLLVLDNLETILEPGAPVARYREGYAGYGEVLRRLGESVHQGCLLLTGREAPPELAPLARERGPVRTLRLGGLGPEVGRALLQDRGLRGDEAACDALVARFNGNPLALSMVGETIGTVFGGDIATFLAQETAVFGGIRQLLDEQVGRLSALEREIATWLAVEREPVGFAELATDVGPGVPRGEIVEAVEALLRRSLLERGGHGTFTLQPVVLEHATARLVAALAEEILTGEPALLVKQALLKAQAKDYVRRSQERLIAEPLLDRLRGRLGSVEALEKALRALLGRWRGRAVTEQGYGPGNVVNLLRLLRGDLRGVDLSHLSVRQAYLQEVVMSDASLAGALLSETMLGDAFAAVNSVALSADAAYVAAGTLGGEVRVWRVVDRTLLASVQGHSGGVLGVAFGADGRLLASCSMDGTVRLWEAPSGQPLATLDGHSSGIWSVALSADGRLVVGGGQDGTVWLWEAPSGRLLTTLKGHTGLVWDVALSGDGQLLASGSRDGTVRLWEAPSGRSLASFQGHSGGAWSVALSGDGRLLASGDHDGTVRLWDVGSGRPLASFQGHTGGVSGLVFANNGQLLAGSGHDGMIRLWEAPSGRPLATLQGHTGLVRGVALSADGRLLASGGHDGTVRLWEAAGGRPLTTLRGHAGGISGVVFSADGRLLASGGQDRAVRLWELPSGRPLDALHGHAGVVSSLAFSADGRLASGSHDGTVRLWDVGSGRPLAILEGHSDGIWGVALSADGRLLASSSMDRTVRLWEAPSGRPLATLQGHNGGVWGVALSADGQLLASGSFDGTVRLWELPSGQPLATLRGHTGVVYGVALSADGRLVASSSYDGTARLWEASSGACLRVLRGDRRYERMDITGLMGVTDAQRAALLALGAVDAQPGLHEIP